MTTGAAWSLTNPKKPVADFDTDAVRDIPFNWVAWLTDIDSTYAAHTVVAELPLEVAVSSENSGIITARVQIAAGQTPIVGTKCAVTCHMVAADGQEDDQTVYLKLVNK